MKRITIDIVDWSRQHSDQDLLRVVKMALQNSIKYESDRALNKVHVWHDPDKRVELGIKFE